MIGAFGVTLKIPLRIRRLKKSDLDCSGGASLKVGRGSAVGFSRCDLNNLNLLDFGCESWLCFLGFLLLKIDELNMVVKLLIVGSKSWKPIDKEEATELSLI
jgi:hypothetical protein